eukprot:TRINITY_DN1904_c0_g1_i3.p2 TRINITY_DN1904_c0_g1~~TRINITY_DN1904_c0_g1_i3.p2  ORF type:complete len:226 (+),score=64.33 TRINITY_DN1904_c0_g1_i3:806-1483(+)
MALHQGDVFVIVTQTHAQNPSVMIVIVAAGVQAGVLAGWVGCLAQLLSALGYTPQQAGWLGFAYTVAVCFGSFCVGVIADRFMARHLKLLLLLIFAASLCCFVWFSLSLPSIFSSDPLIPSDIYVILIAISLAGYFVGFLAPVFFELGAELSFPVPEGTSAGLLTFVFNFSTFAVLFVAPLLPTNWLNAVAVGALAACAAATLFVRERYLRRDQAYHSDPPPSPR